MKKSKRAFVRLGLFLFYIIFLNIYATGAKEPKVLFYETFDSPEKVESNGGQINKGGFVKGKFGKAFLSDDWHNYIEYPVEGKIKPESGTIEFWVMMPNKMEDNTTCPIFDYLGTANWWDRIFISLVCERIAKLTIFVDFVQNKDYQPHDNILLTVQKWQSKTWHHIAITWENINSGSSNVLIKLYCDGIQTQKSSRLTINIVNRPDVFRIGSAHQSMIDVATIGRDQSHMNILIDELKIWDSPIVPEILEDKTNSN